MNTSPVRQRHIILDALRGFALLGICMANFPEFSLYSFQSQAVIENMPSAHIDKLTHFLQLFLIDGKFYTIFSLLFGIGFSIILDNANKRGINGNRLFFRRMIGLAIIGFLHLMLLWSGDILLLYALMGMLLPIFMRLSNRRIFTWAIVFLALPSVWDTIAYFLGKDPALFAYNACWQRAGEYGITEENFGTWLRDANSYTGVRQFLVQGAFERLWEFVDSSRYFKVLGLFLIGTVIGRGKVYARLAEYRSAIRKTVFVGLLVGIPLSVVYALIGTGAIEMCKPVRSLVYLVSVYPLGFAYCGIFVLAYLKSREGVVWKLLSNPGRMALTNYVGQSVFGIILFYGIGFGLGASFGLTASVITAVAVFCVQVVISIFWLRHFNFGPLEWLWRMWNYGKYLKLRK